MKTGSTPRVQCLCPSCHRSGYHVRPSADRPTFKCNSCGHVWDKGRGLSPDLLNAENYGGEPPSQFAEFHHGDCQRGL